MNKKEKNQNPSGRKTSWKKTVLICVCVFLAIVLVALIAATAYLESLMGLIGRYDPNGTLNTMSESEYNEMVKNEETLDPDETLPEMNAEDVEWDDVPDLIQGKNIINILLIGQDRREGESRARSDSMILCTINLSKKTLTMSSFMRDMYVQIPGYSSNRINASYAFGGMQLLDECLKKNFDIDVQGNVEVDFFGFKDAIDILGGVDIELTAAEARYLNRRGNWEVEDNAWEWNLTEGVNRLNGSQATAYSRIRDVGNGDFGRTNRQRTVLNALMEKAKKMSISQLNELLKKLLPLITTDMSNADIMGLAMELFPILSELEVTTQQIPAEGSYQMTMISGMSVLVPDLKKNCDLLAEIMAD